MEARKRILLIDDHVIIRNGLAELIEKLGPYKVVKQYDNGRQLVNDLPFADEPDLIITDIGMPEMDGEEMMQHISRNNIMVPVLVLSLNENESQITRLFRMGVRGYLNKNCSASSMRSALQEIFTFGYYHNDLSATAIKIAHTAPRPTTRELILERLSERELEFLKLVCSPREYTYVQISELLGVKQRTVDGYREQIFDKFDIRSKSGLILFVIKHKLIDNLFD